MSASEDTLIDTICPHGHDTHHPPELAFADDSGRWGTGQGIIYHPNPERMGTEWIAADRDAFVEVGRR